MRPPLTQHDLLAAIHHDAAARPDQAIRQCALGDCLVGLLAARVGLASRTSFQTPDEHPPRLPLPAPGTSARSVTDLLLSPDTQDTDQASLGMAAANALLPPPETASPTFGQDVLAAHGQGKNVAVIGHFPFVEAARPAYANYWVLEKRPQPGDLDANQADRLLPQADLVAITATTLLNGTLAETLNTCRPDALIILLGPTTPFAPSLFECGIDILAGCHCAKPEAAMAGVGQHRFFRHLDGARQLAWCRPGLHL